ncbi:maleylacetoacetate isomerase [Sphingobium sp. YR768]|uniref:maleylacetoacetate isomerase n=1 Tax=Sphingobium sp. YR768 TaxID=1884365 RepID=UPI0008CC26C7|nr:maleylacetoacetate isomerase [Sphingobium sp. YR768]SER29608.1 maleylacetoacetate isomerase [Sphingobium sp. YR768]
MLLHGYFRSTASYRVRIALNLKSIAYSDAFHHLRRGEQNAPDYLALNPQGLLPTLETGDAVLTQSLAICEYLDEVYPDPPIIPSGVMERAHVRAFSQAIACDIHPVQNLKILDRLRALGLADADINSWARTVIEDGLAACDMLIAGTDTPFCFGDAPTLADICLVPQLVNARRFGADLKWDRLLAIEARCLELDAFAKASPEQQPDAE